MEIIDREKYLTKVTPDKPISQEEFSNALRNAHKIRTNLYFRIWRKLKELYPEVDADKLVIDVYREFGIDEGKKWGSIESAADGLYKQSSRAGYLAFSQELKEISEDYAQKDFHYCPHIEVLKELGASKEEIQFFCQKVLSSGDYGNLVPYEGYELIFKKQIGAGDDHCEYCLRKCNK